MKMPSRFNGISVKLQKLPAPFRILEVRRIPAGRWDEALGYGEGEAAIHESATFEPRNRIQGEQVQECRHFLLSPTGIHTDFRGGL